MATYRLSVKVIGRSDNKTISSVAAAAYRAEEKLKDEQKEITFDYSKKNYCLHKQILTPEGTAEKLQNRITLWNEVEKCEKRKKSQLCKEFQLSLPHELKLQEQKRLVENFCNKELVSKGMICDIAIHNEKQGNKNFHAHILTTMRDIEGESFGKKNREWNGYNNGRDWKPLLQDYRNKWEKEINNALEQQSIKKKVSCLSNKERGLEAPKKSYNQSTFRYFQRVASEIDKKKLYKIDIERKKITFSPPVKLAGKTTFKSKRTRKYFIKNIFSFISKEFLKKLKEKIKTLNEQKNEPRNDKLQKSLRGDDERSRDERIGGVNSLSNRREPRPDTKKLIAKLKRGSTKAVDRAFAKERELAREMEQRNKEKQMERKADNDSPSRGPKL
jgi:hypothetical protein